MGKINRLSLILVLMVTCAGAVGGEPVQPPLPAIRPDGTFIRTWLLCGPFSNPPNKPRVPGHPHIYDHTAPCVGLETDYLKEHGGEEKIVPAVGMNHRGLGGGRVKWFRYTSPLWKVPFRAAITRRSNVVAYAYGEVEAPKAGRYLLALGSDEGVRVWVNGRLVHRRLLQRPIVKDDDIVPVALKKGRNRILIKVEQGWGGWGFALRILPEASVIARIDQDSYLGVMTITVRTLKPGPRQPFALLSEGNTIAKGYLLADERGQATGVVEVPFPPPDKPLGLLTITVDGKPCGKVQVPPLIRAEGKPLPLPSDRFHAPQLF